jgi:hypothetical protein
MNSRYIRVNQLAQTVLELSIRQLQTTLRVAEQERRKLEQDVIALQLDHTQALREKVALEEQIRAKDEYNRAKLQEKDFFFLIYVFFIIYYKEKNYH